MLIAAIKETGPRLEDIIGDTGVELHRHGHRLWACCPLHDEQTPSFMVDPDRQRWHCFGSCAMGGDILDFIRKYYRVDFKGALKHLGINGGRIVLTPAERSKIAKAKEKREMMLARTEWRANKIDELSLYIRCAYWLTSGIKTEKELEERGFLYDLLPVWEYQLSILIYGFDWQKFQFLAYDMAIKER